MFINSHPVACTNVHDHISEALLLLHRFQKTNMLLMADLALFSSLFHKVNKHYGQRLLSDISRY